MKGGKKAKKARSRHTAGEKSVESRRKVGEKSAGEKTAKRKRRGTPGAAHNAPAARKKYNDIYQDVSETRLHPASSGENRRVKQTTFDGRPGTPGEPLERRKSGSVENNRRTPVSAGQYLTTTLHQIAPPTSRTKRYDPKLLYRQKVRRSQRRPAIPPS